MSVAAPTKNPGEDAKRAFRMALGMFATGVTVVTTRAPDGSPLGVTANSFNSVSLNPPLVLWSLAKSAYSRPAFEQGGHWAVHVLSAHQEAISRRFASAGSDKFQDLPLEVGIGGVPLLSGCCARLECRTYMCSDAGDHVILVGEVLKYVHANLPPLLFHRGRYAMAMNRESERASLSPGDELEPSLGEDLLGYLLFRAYHQFHAPLWARLADNNLSVDEFVLLATLLHKDGQDLTEVTERLAITPLEPPELAARQLVERGYIRAIEGRDGPLRLTESGRDLALGLFLLVRSLEGASNSSFGVLETVCLKDMLRRFIIRSGADIPHLWGELRPDSNSKTS